MPKSTSICNSIINLMYRATAWANVADNAAASPLTDVYVALHTADLTAGTNSQAEDETAYTNYARQAVARSTGWAAASGGGTENAATISFPQCGVTGATGVGKYNYAMPLQGGDGGIAEINTIQNSTSYVSGEYSVALFRELAHFPLSTLGLAAEQNFMFGYPSLPRIYDGAALYWLCGSGVATPANSAFSGDLDFVWN